MPMIPVASATSGFEAKLLAARLGSEGVVWELRPDVDGVYPVSDIEILVPADEVDRARDVLGSEAADLDAESWSGDSTGGFDRGDERTDADVRIDVVRRHRRGLATAVLATVIAFMVVRLIALG
jgi:hypothetical protein